MEFTELSLSLMILLIATPEVDGHPVRFSSLNEPSGPVTSNMHGPWTQLGDNDRRTSATDDGQTFIFPLGVDRPIVERDNEPSSDLEVWQNMQRKLRKQAQLAQTLQQCRFLTDSLVAVIMDDMRMPPKGPPYGPFQYAQISPMKDPSGEGAESNIMSEALEPLKRILKECEKLGRIFPSRSQIVEEAMKELQEETEEAIPETPQED